MSSNRELAAIGATRIAVGTSTIMKITAGAYHQASSIKIFSGGGTLEITPIPAVANGSTGWGLGYPLGTSEVYNWTGPATFYLAATGATMVAALALGYTKGVDTP